MEYVMEIPEDLLSIIEFLPDGTATNNAQVWLEAWTNYTRELVQTGKIQLHELECYDEENDKVPLKFIKEVYLTNRKLH